MNIKPTLSLQDATERVWDALVVGAGPAGSLAARQLARDGLQVLLVDKAVFPRWKVCGCCLNANALSTLRSVGLSDLVATPPAVPLLNIHLAGRRRSAQVRLGESVALSREAFDAGLIATAIQEGVSFLPGTMAKLVPQAQDLPAVCLDHNGQTVSCRSRVVLVADGLGGRFFGDNSNFNSIPSATSWIGLGAIVHDFPKFYEAGSIYMATGRQGYVGLVCLEDGRLDVAAAFDHTWIKGRGPGHAARLIIQEVGWPLIPSLVEGVWRGTPPLTRQRRRVAGERLFVLGDASGYVEPFTGEGMAWALTSAVALAPIAAKAARQWQPAYADVWSRLHLRLVRNRQRACRVIAWGLRHPGLVSGCLAVLKHYPAIASPLVRHLSKPAWDLERNPHEFHHPGHRHRASP